MSFTKKGFISTKLPPLEEIRQTKIKHGKLEEYNCFGTA
jgi:hypothetical protein